MKRGRWVLHSKLLTQNVYSRNILLDSKEFYHRYQIVEFWVLNLFTVWWQACLSLYNCLFSVTISLHIHFRFSLSFFGLSQRSLSNITIWWTSSSHNPIFDVNTNFSSPSSSLGEWSVLKSFLVYPLALRGALPSFWNSGRRMIWSFHCECSQPRAKIPLYLLVNSKRKERIPWGGNCKIWPIWIRYLR